MDAELKKKCCNNCKLNGLSDKCEKLKSLFVREGLDADEIQDRSLFSKQSEKRYEIKQAHCCKDFSNRWLEYPIAVKEVKVEDIVYNEYWGGGVGSLVKIRPCAKEYANKTYLGFLLGNLPTSIMQSYNSNENVLTVSTFNNPAIFIPEIGKIIFGCESWWGKINSEEDLKQITDCDIENVWYVKALKKQMEEKASE